MEGLVELTTPVLSNTGTDRGLPISCFGIDVDSIYDIGKKNLELMLLLKTWWWSWYWYQSD